MTGRRRCLAFGQAVNTVVHQENGKVEIVAKCVHPVAHSDSATVTIARYDENFEIGPTALDAAGQWQRPPVQTVKAVSLHVMRKTTGASDAGNDHRFFRRQLFVTGQSLNRTQDSMVATSRTPPRHRRAIVLQLTNILVNHRFSQSCFSRRVHLATAAFSGQLIIVPTFSRLPTRSVPAAMGFRERETNNRYRSRSGFSEQCQLRVAAAFSVDKGFAEIVAVIDLDRHDFFEASENLLDSRFQRAHESQMNRRNFSPCFELDRRLPQLIREWIPNRR